MSFGVVQSAIASIKSNRNLLSKRNKLKNTLTTKKEEKLEFKSPDATYYELELLRKKMQKENKRIRIEQIIVFIIIVFYFMFIAYVFLFT